MLATLRKRFDREDEGFTLIELMVVVLIIAILLAIAIPTFLGARERANDRAAQSSLRNTLTAAKTIYTDNQSYASATDAALDTVEPSLNHVGDGTDSTDFKEVSVDGTAGTAFFAAALSKSGTCFYIKDSSGAGGGTTYLKDTSSPDCDADYGVTNSATFAANGW